MGFFGTTTTSTSVLTTSTFCYKTDTISASCRKRKRSITLDNPIEGAKYHLDSRMIFPSSSANKKSITEDKREPTRNDKSLPISKLEELNQIANVRASDKNVDERVDPRFFLFYWYTSTITTTSTPYSTTKTFTLTKCTPAAGFAYAACG